MKLPTNTEFQTAIENVESECYKDVALFFYRNSDEFYSLEHVARVTGHTMNKVRQAKTGLTHRYGFCFCYIGSNQNRAHKMFSVAASGVTMSEAEYVMTYKNDTGIRFRGKSSGDVNITLKPGKGDKLINDVFK